MIIDNDTHERQFFPDMGYSFCNCKSVWFTDWSNIHQDAFEFEQEHHKTEEYRKAVINPLQYYILKDKITNKGYGKNKFLELGSISPFLLDEAKRLGWQTTGWDKYQRENFNHELIVGDFETKLCLKKFDIIWASHIFEHFHYPLKALQKCYDLLNTGGIMFIAMPDPYLIDFGNAYAWQHWLLREHHIMWDMDSFCEEIENVGFKILMKERNIRARVLKDYHIICQK